MNEFNISAYYVFNDKRFSFPAALLQNYHQLRSAGSWLAGLSFQSGSPHHRRAEGAQSDGP